MVLSEKSKPRRSSFLSSLLNISNMIFSTKSTNPQRTEVTIIPQGRSVLLINPIKKQMRMMAQLLSQKFSILLSNITNMKRIIQMIPVLFVMFFNCLAFSQTSSAPVYSPGEIYIKYYDTYPTYWNNTHEVAVSSLEELAPFIDSFGITKVENSFYFSRFTNERHILRVYFSEVNKIEELIEKLNCLSKIEFAEKVPYMSIHMTYNDPRYSNVSAAFNLVNANTAHDIQTGNSGVVIAVIDNGTQTNHPDLIGQLHSSRDVSDNDNNPAPLTNAHNHGTHTSGTACARTNNSVGIPSVGYNCRLMAIKAVSNSNSSTTAITHGFPGISWAVNNGADVINCSWGGSGFSLVNQIVTNNAWNNDVIVVASAGNNGNTTIQYPAGYPNVIAVANTTLSDTRHSSSSYGSYVDICAPGVFEHSLIPGNSYASFTGTSMSSPKVAATIALIKSCNMTASKTSIVNCLLNSTVPLSWTGSGSGRLDVRAAVVCASPASAITPPNDQCINAITLTSNTTCINTSGTVNNATPDGYVATCDSFSGTPSAAGVFYKFNAVSTSHTVTITPKSSSTLDIVGSALTGSNCYALSQIACEDVPGYGTVILNLSSLTIGQTIWVRIYDYGAINTTAGDFDICATHTVSTPTNHDFYVQNLTTDYSTYNQGASFRIDVDQYTSLPSGSKVYPVVQYTIESMSGATLHVLGTDPSSLGKSSPTSSPDPYDNESLSGNFPLGLPTSCKICAEANYNRGEPENPLDTLNNKSCVVITINPSTPLLTDLSPRNLILGSATLTKGSSVPTSYSYTIDENNSVATGSSFTSILVWSPTPIYSSSTAVVLSTDLIPAITAGGSHAVSGNFTVPTSISSLGGYILVVVNPTNTIVESNTGNQSISIGVTLVNPLPQIHDFYTSGFSLNQTSFQPNWNIFASGQVQTTNPAAPSTIVLTRFCLRDNSNNLVHTFHIDTSNLGGGIAQESENYFEPFFPNLALSSGTYQLCFETNINGTTESNFINNSSIIWIYYTSSTTNLGEIEGDINFIVFPNPTSDYITISGKDMTNEPYTIIDMNGKIVKQETLNSNYEKIELTNLSEGTYLLVIKNQSMRIIKD